MPEGPEVRLIVDKIRPSILGRTITEIIVTDKMKKKVKDLDLFSVGTILAIEAYGKKIIITLSSDVTIIISVLMFGSLQYQPSEHAHVTFQLSSQKESGLTCFYYIDKMRWGEIRLLASSLLPAYLAKMGPDLLQAALTTWLTADMWLSIITVKRNSKKQICEVLLDPKTITGIGNYLKSEILYLAAVLPTRIVSTLTLAELECLRVVAHQTILKSYKSNGLTIKSLVYPDHGLGLYQPTVYMRIRDNNGFLVQQGQTKDKRKSYWVNEVQK